MTELLDVRNPRTGECDYQISVAGDEEIQAVAAELRANQTAWSGLGLRRRIEVLQSFKDAIAASKAGIVAALATDTGRTAIALIEVSGLMSRVDHWCAVAPMLVDEKETASNAAPNVCIRRQYDPYPLLGVISPWNFPLLLSLIDAIPALLAGCAAIIKPSEVAPRFAAAVGDVVSSVPELRGVLRFVSGDGRTGAALVRRVDVVAFTGGVDAGREVAAAAAAAFVPAFLELGGKDPAVLLPGCDLDRASTSVLRASVIATGQACQSIERVYVHSSQHEDFVERLSSKARAVKLTYPVPDSGVLGPLISARQAKVIRAQLEDAVARGATVVTGGEVRELGGGLWIEPTVLTGVDHSMAVMTEETFGPVMPVMAYDSIDEAVALANDSAYGLSGAVFGETEEAALEVARRIDAGGISINDAGMTAWISEAQKSAYGCSGMGQSRAGPSGFLRFFRQKALYVNRADEVSMIEDVAEGS